MYNLAKFARVYGAQSGNMCKFDHQALPYSKVLSETHLLIGSIQVRKHTFTCLYNAALAKLFAGHA